MDPPLINEGSFSTKNPSLAEIWPLSCSNNNGGGGFMSELINGFVSSDNNDGDCVDNKDGLVEESTVTYQCASFVCGGFKRKDCVSQSTCGAYALESSCKRMKPSDSMDGNSGLKGGVGEDSSDGNKKRVEKPSEPPKDYIHVRARRGQATDSHSLAERVRREKISERMKILQDLVPGCNKVIGKALVLDEIINYIQSLQQQVEFLSMKLEAVTSGMIPSINGVHSKDMSQLVAPSFDACGMMFDAQGLNDLSAVAAGPQSEWLHMQLGGHYAHT